MPDTAAPTTIARGAGAALAMQFIANPPTVEAAGQSQREGGTVRGMVVSVRPAANLKSFGTVDIWVLGDFKESDVPPAIGKFISREEIELFGQERFSLDATSKADYAARGVKISAQAKYTLPKMIEGKRIKWCEIIRILCYAGKNMKPGGKPLHPGEYVALKNLYWNVSHKKEEVSEKDEKGETVVTVVNTLRTGWEITGIERSIPVGLAGHDFTSGFGHMFNRLIDFTVPPERAAIIDPKFLTADEKTQNAEWFKAEIRESQLNPDQQLAANSLYLFPLQPRHPGNKFADAVGRFLINPTWTFKTKLDEEAKQTQISSGTFTVIQVNEASREGPYASAAMAVSLWPSTLHSMLIVNNAYEGILKALLATSEGTLMASPNVLAQSEVTDEKLMFQMNFKSNDLYIDLPRSIMQNAIEIPGGIAAIILKGIEASREYFKDKNQSGFDVQNAAVINLCETMASTSDSNYKYFFIAAPTFAKLQQDGSYKRCVWHTNLISKFTEDEAKAFWPYWAGTIEQIPKTIRGEFHENLEFVKFDPRQAWIVFAIHQEQVERVNNTRFPDHDIAMKVFTDYQVSRGLVTSDMDDAIAQAERESLERKRKAEQDQEAKRQKTEEQNDTF